MVEAVCSYCGRKFQVTSVNDLPEFCESCNSPLTNANIKESVEGDNGGDNADPIEIILTYQKTGEKINIPLEDRLILGREHFGKEVLAKIPQISRAHCSIELKNHEIIVNDIGSKNGTFIGLDKVDCKQHPDQKLKDGDFLQLGREVFLVKVVYSQSDKSSKSEEPTTSAAVTETGEKKVIKYRCKACGKVFDEKFDICPNDNSFGTMEEIVE